MEASVGPCFLPIPKTVKCRGNSNLGVCHFRRQGFAHFGKPTIRLSWLAQTAFVSFPIFQRSLFAVDHHHQVPLRAPINDRPHRLPTQLRSISKPNDWRCRSCSSFPLVCSGVPSFFHPPKGSIYLLSSIFAPKRQNTSWCSTFFVSWVSRYSRELTICSGGSTGRSFALT